MHPIPNWFRWLLIAIASLILCGCRAPFQDGMAPFLLPPTSQAPAVRTWQPASNPELEPFGQAVVDHLAQLTNTQAGTKTEDHEGHSIHVQLRNPVAPGRTRDSTLVIVEPSRDPLPSSVMGEAAVAPMTDLPAPSAALPAPEPLFPATAHVVEDSDAEQAEQHGDPAEWHVEPQAAPIPGAVGEEGIVETTAAEGLPVIEYGSVIVESVVDEDGKVIANDLPPEICLVDPEMAPTVHAIALSKQYPDEYICDGGDSGGSVVLGRNQELLGLEPEDTVAVFDLADGEAVVQPSNRVCIYAPRFAAVRKVTSTHQSGQNIQVVLAERKVPAITGRAQRAADQFVQNLAAQRHLGLQPAASFRSRQLGVETSQEQALHTLSKDLSAHENLRVMKFGVHKQSEKARLADFTARAITWSHDKAVQVILDEVITQTRVSRRGLGEIFSIGGEGPAKLRVIKTASVSDALPGEEVEFTIRFDNVGFQPVNNVTVVDNLTTRLEYILDSQLCSFDAEFLEDQNTAESLTLRWKIVEPINPGKGGLIRFRCRVR